MSDSPSDGNTAAASDDAADADDGLDPTTRDRSATLDADRSADGLAHLVLSLVKLLHDLLEKQAIRRMESGRLTDEEVERVGQTLMRQAEEIEELCEIFGFEPDDLELPLGSVRVTDRFDDESAPGA